MAQYTFNPPLKNNVYYGTQSDGRFYVHSNVFLPNSEIDHQTGMPRDPSRRVGRTQALRREDRQLDIEMEKLQIQYKARMTEKGIRIPLKAAIALIAAVLFVFIIILLVQYGNIVSKKNELRQLNAKIIATQEVVSNITAKIEEASDKVQICYTAARDLDMVPGDSAQAIYLSALSTRPSQDPIAIRAGND